MIEEWHAAPRPVPGGPKLPNQRLCDLPEYGRSMALQGAWQMSTVGMPMRWRAGGRHPGSRGRGARDRHVEFAPIDQVVAGPAEELAIVQAENTRPNLAFKDEPRATAWPSQYHFGSRYLRPMSPRGLGISRPRRASVGPGWPGPPGDGLPGQPERHENAVQPRQRTAKRRRGRASGARRAGS